MARIFADRCRLRETPGDVACHASSRHHARMLVRHADPQRDAPACAAIYAPYVTGSGVSFEDVAPTAQQFAARIAETSRGHPWLVLDDEHGRVAGYAYASQHHERAGYRWAADVAVYVDSARQGRGSGRRLSEALLELLRRQRLRSACAGIALPNEASIGLHGALGFEHVGTYRDIGWKAGAWRDVSWWQLQLQPDAPRDGPPPEPLGPQRL
jgi:L-amino acid N-acyltransferase YncA